MAKDGNHPRQGPGLKRKKVGTRRCKTHGVKNEKHKEAARGRPYQTLSGLEKKVKKMGGEN